MKLGQVLLYPDMVRISRLSREQKDVEVEELMAQAEGLNQLEMARLRYQLEMLLDDPDRYQRIPDERDVKVSGSPYPHQEEE